MNYVLWLKRLGRSFLYLFGILLVLTFLMTLLHYFNLIPYRVVTILKIIIPILSLFIGGFVIAKNSKEKGWLEGMKLGMIFLILLMLFNYLGLSKSFEIKDFIYYLILFIASTFGGMVGINFTTIEK